MARLLSKMLNLVGWESEEEDVLTDEMHDSLKEDTYYTQRFSNPYAKKASQNKVVNIHSDNQFKVVIMQPDTFDGARDVCDHLKNKKPVVVNLESLSKETAQRVVDFLSGAVYGLDGDIQKVSSEIFLIAPYNVDVHAEFKDELKGKGAFPWIR